MAQLFQAGFAQITDRPAIDWTGRCPSTYSYILVHVASWLPAINNTASTSPFRPTDPNRNRNRFLSSSLLLPPAQHSADRGYEHCCIHRLVRHSVGLLSPAGTKVESPPSSSSPPTTATPTSTTPPKLPIRAKTGNENKRENANRRPNQHSSHSQTPRSVPFAPGPFFFFVRRHRYR